MQDAIQAQQVIAKMSALGMGESNSGEPAQPLYANAAEDNTNANNRTSADRENNSIPVSFRADAVNRFLRISVQSLCTETDKASAPQHFSMFPQSISILPEISTVQINFGS